MSFKRELIGYDRESVDDHIYDLNKSLEEKNSEISQLQKELDDLKREYDIIVKRNSVTEKANEEIARLALKEASDLISKAKRNANMILKESMEYVKGLNSEIDGFKDKAIEYRSEVVKMSQDLLDTIDKSEIFSLIKEEENTEKETD